MAGRYLHIDLFVKVRMYECVYRIVLDHLKVETSGDSHKGISLTAKTLHFLALRHLHLATSKIHGWGPTTYLIKYPLRIFYKEILYAISHFVPVRMADGQ